MDNEYSRSYAKFIWTMKKKKTLTLIPLTAYKKAVSQWLVQQCVLDVYPLKCCFLFSDSTF